MQNDNRTCQDGPLHSLIFAHRVDIRQISLDVPYVVDVVLPLPPLRNAIAVDVDRKTGKNYHYFYLFVYMSTLYALLFAGELYWTDTAEDIIQKATPDGKFVEPVIIDGLETADGIVIDSSGRKVRILSSLYSILCY